MIDVYQPLRLTDIFRMRYLLDNNFTKDFRQNNYTTVEKFACHFFFQLDNGYFASKPMSLPKIVHVVISSAHVPT